MASSKKKAFRGFKLGPGSAASSGRELIGNYESSAEERNQKPTSSSIDNNNFPFVTKSNFF